MLRAVHNPECRFLTMCYGQTFPSVLMLSVLFLIDSLYLTDEVLGDGNRQWVRPLAVLVVCKLSYTLNQQACNQLSISQRTYEFWAWNLNSAFLTATTAAGCRTYRELYIYCALDSGLCVLKMVGLSTITQPAPLLSLWRRFQRWGRQECPPVDGLNERQFRFYELGAELEMSTVGFACILAMYPLLLLVDESVSTGPKRMFFPYGYESFWFVFLMFCFQAAEDFVFAEYCMWQCGRCFCNLFWHPLRKGSRMTILTATSQLWLPAFAVSLSHVFDEGRMGRYGALT